MSKMTIEQHSDYVDDLYKMLRKIERLHGVGSPQSKAMASIHFKELMAYLERVSEKVTKASLGGG